MKTGTLAPYKRAFNTAFQTISGVSRGIKLFDAIRYIWSSLSPMIQAGIGSMAIYSITLAIAGDKHFLYYFVGALILQSLVQITLSNFADYFLAGLADSMELERKNIVIRITDNLDPARAMLEETIRAKTQFQERGWRTLQTIYSSSFNVISQCVAMIVAIFTTIALLNTTVVILSVVSAICTLAVGIRAHKRAMNMWEDGHENREHFEAYNMHALSVRTSLQSKFHGTKGYFLSRFYDTLGVVHTDNKRLRSVYRSGRIYVSLFDLLCTLFAVCIAINAALVGQLSVAMWPLVIGATAALKTSMVQMGGGLVMLTNSLNDNVKYYQPFCDIEPLYRSGQIDVSNGILPVNFQNVDFKYPGSESPFTIKGINLEIGTRERIAITGPNGSGKTTLLSLMSGTYYPTVGTILLNGVPTSAANRDSIYVPMLIDLAYSGAPSTTVREFVAASKCTTTDELIWKSLDVMGLGEYIRSLAHGLDTYIGTRWKEGVELSTGQYKRLSLATVYYRVFSKGSKVQMVVLDEPMGNIDHETRVWFYETVATGDLFGSATIMVCLHDNWALRFFPRQIKMKNGKIMSDIRRKQ